MINVRETFRSHISRSDVDNNKRIDANELMFFANELTQYDPIPYETLKSKLTAFEVFYEKKVPEYSSVYTYQMFDGFGKSKYAAKQNGKTKDTPFVGAGGKQYSLTLQDAICALAFSDADLLASTAIRRDVVFSLRRQAMRSNYELMNNTCFYGDKELGLGGLLNNKFVANPVAVASGKDWTKTANNTATAEIMYSDLLAGYNKILTDTKNLITPNILLIAPALYNAINSKIFNTYNGVTVRQQIETAQTVKVVVTPELSGAFTGGKDGFVFMNNDPDFIEHVVAVLFNTKAPQAQGLEYISYCYSRHGGLVIRQPKGISIFYNGNT